MAKAVKSFSDIISQMLFNRSFSNLNSWMEKHESLFEHSELQDKIRLLDINLLKGNTANDYLKTSREIDYLLHYLTKALKSSAKPNVDNIRNNVVSILEKPPLFSSIYISPLKCLISIILSPLSIRIILPPEISDLISALKKSESKLSGPESEKANIYATKPAAFGTGKFDAILPPDKKVGGPINPTSGKDRQINGSNFEPSKKPRSNSVPSNKAVSGNDIMAIQKKLPNIISGIVRFFARIFGVSKI